MYFKGKVASDKHQVALVGGKEATKVSQLVKKVWMDLFYLSCSSLLLLLAFQIPVTLPKMQHVEFRK